MTRIVVYSLLLAFLSKAAHSQVKEPPLGKTVHDVQTVSLPTNIPERCISLSVPAAYVILSRDAIESAAAMAFPDSGLTEDDRVKKRRGHLAKILLQRLTERRDPYGCWTIERTAAGDSFHLFTGAINNLSAVVVSTDTGTPVDRVSVQFTAQAGINGVISYLLPNKRLFITTLWWIS